MLFYEEIDVTVFVLMTQINVRQTRHDTKTSSMDSRPEHTMITHLCVDFPEGKTKLVRKTKFLIFQIVSATRLFSLFSCEITYFHTP